MTKQLLTCFHGLYSGGGQHLGLLKHSLFCSSETPGVKPEARHRRPPRAVFRSLMSTKKTEEKKELEENQMSASDSSVYFPSSICCPKQEYCLSSASYCSADLSFDDKSTNHTCLVTFTPEESMSLWTWIIPVSVMV